jgi:pyrroline-5-carboxylate reductase
MNITFIGGGNMASALIGGLLNNGFAAGQLQVVDVSADARARVERTFGVGVHATLSDAVAAAGCVVLAIKPQQMRATARALQPLIAGQLVITIAAGIRLRDLARWLGGHGRLVRAMPNTPALVASGLSALFAAPGVSADDKALAQRVLGAAGTTLWLANEEQMDAVTAISGSGPAYVFYFIEALEQAACELGFDAGSARRLALETFAGAVRLAQHSEDDAATLRARVTSKGGTTERALGCMKADGVRQSIVRALHAAAERSRELGEELGRAD